MTAGAAPLTLGVDVGTGSVRAGVFDATGQRFGLGVHPIRLFRPEEDFVEQSQEGRWADDFLTQLSVLVSEGCDSRFLP